MILCPIVVPHPLDNSLESLGLNLTTEFLDQGMTPPKIGEKKFTQWLGANDSWVKTHPSENAKLTL